MTKVLKRVLLVLVMMICGLALVGCQMGGDTPSGDTPSGDKTIAKLDSSKQGTYYGDDVVVEITESKVKITDPTGKVQEFTIYSEGDKYYIEEEGEKVYCTFGDGTVSNKHGTFSKNGGTPSGTDTPAQIDASLQGDYFAGGLKVTVSASKVKVTDPTGHTMEYNLYQENGRIYFYENGQKIYCTFGEGSVENIYGKFTRDGGTVTTISAEEAALKFAGFLEFNEQFRVPNGEAIADMTSHDETGDTYVITIVNPSETYEAYKEYFDGFFSKLGYTSGQASWVKMEGTTKGKGAAISYEVQTKTLAIVASKFDLGGNSDEMNVSDFLSLFKEKSGLEIKLPTDVQKITGLVNNEENGYIYLAGSFTYGDPSDSESIFNELVAQLDNVLAPKGYDKGTPSVEKYANVVSYSVQWTDKNYAFVTFELLSYSGMNEFSISYSGDVYSSGGNGEQIDSWPASQIAEFYSNVVSIPEYNGTFDSISCNRLNQDGATCLQVMIEGAQEKDYNLWINALLTSGFITNEETWYIKYLENNNVAEVYAFLSSAGFASITFKLSKREVTPWPSSLIEQKFGSAVLNVIPVPDSNGNTSYFGNYGAGMLTISVDSGLQTDLFEKYSAALVQAGFITTGNDNYKYVFENNDVIDLTLYRPSYAQNRFSISIEVEEYEGMEYIIPTNFHATISGFTLTKVGESYVYLYSYSNQVTMIEVYLYDSATATWIHADGSIYPKNASSNGGVIWQNYGTNTAPAYYQNVARPQVDEFLEGTNGLAYYYYKLYKEATNAQTDPSKNATIAGVACEYVTFSSSVAAGGASYVSTTELWIDPVSHMIYKVDASLNMNGTVQKNTAFEIKSINTNITSFKDAGIANCILPGFDVASATDNDHAYGEVITVNATCGKDGQKYQVCSACGEKKVIETIKATGAHDPEAYNGEAILVPDYEGHHSKMCKECHEYYDIEDCTYGEWTIITPATCAHDGIRSHTCTKCQDTVRETIPMDKDAHDYTGNYYGENITVVIPTSEKAGSITWVCNECGKATETITLPALNETDYIIGVYYDYSSEKNYTLYGLNMTKLVSDVNALLKPATQVDQWYIISTVFGYDTLVYNYDDNNPLYGFKGAEIADPLASVNQDYRGEFYNSDNNKLALGENSFALTQGEETLSYTLYVDNDGIYYRDSSDNKMYLTLNEDGTISLGGFGDFAKRVIAHLDKDLQGEYSNEGGHVIVTVQESKVIVNQNGKVMEYDIYDDGDYFIVDGDEKVYCYFGDGYVENDFGTFYKPDNGEGEDEGEEDDPYSFPFDKVAEYLGTDEYVYVTWTDAEYAINEDFEDAFVVEMTLPEETNLEEAMFELIGYIEGYGEYGYVDEESGYMLNLGTLDGKVLLMYMLLQ